MTKTKDKQPDRAVNDVSADQESTAAEKVEEAALAMIAREGVLAGLNLNEVAKHAGVTRGLVYHHFGSRRGLLRAALKRRMSSERDSFQTPSEPMRLGARVAHAIRATIKNKDMLALTTLLHLDGSTAPRLMPNAELTLALMQRDQALNLLPDEHDLPALHAAYAAATYGYGLYREVLARDLAVSVDELDRRVIDVLTRLFDGIDKPEPEAG
ncbi:TetR/AcrR family transcriptional regulator [Rhodopseudomonas palustris]|uniref:Regulatory protein, TetR n=1 Tax=Rhodopseudomonas palustris (strain BisB5) TaxID=316057 RepID=Q13CB3_RHOPS|nr:regulatory protein, TetR [Rhodopseudomonas palustris BisB5]MBB1091084.1 TetR/AcrR family transcriptional regulator [Rhodopseudomonas palustris]